MARVTRSRLAPDWTLQEMLTLISEVAAIDEECRTALSTHQKWDIVSDHCVALDVARTAGQCRRKWDSLISEYRAIKAWESRSGPGSYWCLEAGRRGEFGLPGSFDRELFGLIDDVIAGKEKGKGKSDEKSDEEQEIAGGVVVGGGEDEEVEVDDMMMVDPPDLKKMKRRKGLHAMMQELTSSLEESAAEIEATLKAKGGLSEGGMEGFPMVDLSKPKAVETELTRRRADQLIKAFGSLIGNLEQLNELMKEDGSKEFGDLSSRTFI